MMMRQDGYYWIKYKKQWIIGKYYQLDYWMVIGSYEIFNDKDFTEIGPYIGDGTNVT